MKIKFFEIEENKLVSYNYFLNQVSNNDLLELNGFKIRNILSLVFNSKIKDLILENIFNINGDILSNETKDNLFNFVSLEERNDLKNYLTTYLDYQIQSDWFKSINTILIDSSINIIVIPTIILNNELVIAQLKKTFPRKKFVDWFNLEEMSDILILDYNHAWKKRNIFTLKDINTNAIFLKHFFETTYKWKIYKEEDETFKCLNSETRELLFGKEVINELNNNLTLNRPESTLNNWDVLHETDHTNSFNPQEEIIIFYNLNNSNKYRINTSYLLVKDNKYVIINGKTLVNDSKKFEGEFYYSNLENIISQVDLNELNKSIEKDKSLYQIIQPLWEKYNLNENNGRLWKQLMHRKVIDFGLQSIYSEIENISGVRQFVSLDTFENSYCNPQNNTIIPREKKVFKAICQYLELPVEYRAAIHRERNLIGGHSQDLHMKLKDLIYAIVELGVLDKHNNDDELLEMIHYSVQKIENRVDMEYFGLTRESLPYVCVAICYEIIDKMKLKPIFKIEHVIPN
jgi:hypothetical protein